VELSVIPGSPATASLRHLLTELGESGRTGALHIDGSPGGVAAICDATHALLGSDEAAPVRFVPGERHWLGAVTEVELSALGHQTAQRMLTGPAPRSGHHGGVRRGAAGHRPRTRRTRQDAHSVRQVVGRCPQDGSR
jgi:hypothetical protein